jgi:hypothetical protein
MTIRLIITTAFVLTVLPVTLHGQVESINALALETGTHAKIVEAASDSKFALIAVPSARPASLRYSLGVGSSTRSLGWKQITKIEASPGRHRHVGLGLGVGFVAGTLAGIAIGAAGHHGEQRSLKELSGAIAGATIGTIIGGTAGFFWRTDN